MNKPISHRILLRMPLASLFVGLAALLNLPTPATGQCVFPLPGLVSWWPGEGNANDLFGGHPGLLSSNGVTFAAGMVGQAFSFDGTNGFVRLKPDLFPFPLNGSIPGTGPFSFESWFLTSSGGVILGQQLGEPFQTGGHVPAIYVGTDGLLYVQAFWTGRTSRTIASTRPVNDGTFHHVAVTFDGTNRTAYLDGTRIGSQIFTQIPYGISYEYQLGTGNTSGGWPGGTGNWYSFRGLIDEPAYFNRALSSNEVFALYASGTNGMCRPAEPASLIYSNNFDQVIVLSEWSDSDTDPDPRDVRGNARYFGPYTTNRITLTLTNLPTHTNLTLACDLLALGSWDGVAGPHLMDVGIVGGPTLLHSTFQNGLLGGPQSYPSPHRTNDFPGKTGALETDTLGSGGNAVYRFRFNFPHSSNRVVFSFASSNLVTGEQWGLDNVKVYAGGPSVAFVEPTNHTALFAPTNLVVRADAAATTGSLSYVQFLANNILLGTVSNAPYMMTWSNIPGGFYGVTARATDDQGRSTDAITTFQVGGLLGEYFTNVHLAGQPVTNIDPEVNFNWGAQSPRVGLPIDFFSVRWSGEFEPPFTGSYTLSTLANDGVRLWVDGYRVIDDWRPRNTSSNNVVLSLTNGQRYRIQMEMFESNSVAVAQLRSQGPNDPFQAIPASRLVPPAPGVNRPPNAPVITTPSTNLNALSPFGDAVNPTNFQMIVDFFSDPDTGQTHTSSDWDIVLPNQVQSIWQNLQSSHLLTNWLTNGIIVGAAAALPRETNYILRARHRDSSSNPTTEWGGTTQRVFHTFAPFISATPRYVSSYQTNLILTGETVAISVAATNVTPWVRYQWLREGVPVTGTDATNILTLYYVAPADVGGYAAIVSNPAGARTNSPLSLLVDTNFTARAETRFDSDNDGWIAAVGAPSTNFAFSSTGGNPGGYISATNLANASDLYWIAPASFLGNKSDCYGGYLSYDLRVSATVNRHTNDIVLKGSGLTLVFDTPNNPGPVWTFYRIPLLETAGWHKDTTNGPLATQGELLNVLTDLNEMWIRGGFSTSFEVDSIDNVRLLAPRCTPAVLLSARASLNNGFELDWPANACGFEIESTVSLTPAAWESRPLPTTISNGFNRVVIPAPDVTRFFRLNRTGTGQ